MVSYTFFVLGKMVWQNYQVNQQISNLERDISGIEKENQKLSDLIAFFQTETFKEKEAREKLGMVKPGEKVLVFPGDENSENTITDTKGVSEEKNKQEEMPTYKKWWNFFFEPR